MTNVLNGMFGSVKAGLCRLTVDGGIAISTPTGYKTYDEKKGQFINCDEFVFDIGTEMFFVVPTNKVVKGDIIIASGDPRYVLNVQDNMITVVNYKSGTIENILPERHIFLGKEYFYGKIVSMFGDFKKSGGMRGVFKYMMISKLFSKDNTGNKGILDGNNMLPMLMMMNGDTDLFSGLFSEIEDSNKKVEIDDEEYQEFLKFKQMKEKAKAESEE